MQPSTRSTTFLIDPPELFAPLEEWQAFLEDMAAIESDAPEVVDAIAEAERMIAEIKARTK